MSAFRIGVDENGLGARLGPLVVTAVLACVDERGEKALARALPKSIAKDLDDSKRLVAHGNVRLGEAWARVLTGNSCASPRALVERLSLDGETGLQTDCPSHVVSQCWSVGLERFEAEPELLARIAKHAAALKTRGVTLLDVQSKIVCTHRLNQAKLRGHNRFIVDLHSMEALTTALQKKTQAKVKAVCGKVGGITEYPKFFGPLAGLLHTVLAEQAAHSAYHFPHLGELHFVRDADAAHPLVMLASLVGKYLRELLMQRISRFYDTSPSNHFPSGYHDPVTAAFVERSQLLRQNRNIPISCFERAPAILES